MIIVLSQKINLAKLFVSCYSQIQISVFESCAMPKTEGRLYLRNANLLEEIEKSKLSYCCYEKPEDAAYDLGFTSFSVVSPTQIGEFFAQNARDDIVLRIQTDEHIDKTSLAYKKNEMNFLRMIPFKHFRVMRKDFNDVIGGTAINNSKISECEKKIDGYKVIIKDANAQMRLLLNWKDYDVSTVDALKDTIQVNREKIQQAKDVIAEETRQFNTKLRSVMKECLRSHWYGKTIESGYLTFDKGMITDNLARMLIMLAERYMKAGKWSAYTYTDDMVSSAITHMVGVCLKFDEMRSNNPFSFLSQCTGNVYKLILGSEKTQRLIRSQMLQDMGFDAPPNEAYENETAKD